MLFLDGQIKPGIGKLTIRRGQSNFSIAFTFVISEDSAKVVSYSSVLTAARTAGAATVCKAGIK